MSLLQENPGSRTWLTEAETGNLDDAICGLEISFASVPHDIDIKVLPATEGELRRQLLFWNKDLSLQETQLPEK